jgi:hypothetical protein
MNKGRKESKSNASIGAQVFYCVMLLLGVILGVWEVYIYGFTVINVVIPVSIVLTVGITAFLFNKGHYRKIFNMHGIFFPLLQNIGSWGFISCYLVMAVNYYGADVDARNVKLPIKSKSWRVPLKGSRNKRSPYVIVNHMGIDKELVFAYADTKRVNAAKIVTLNIRQGLLGFDIIDHYDVVD